MGHGRSLWAAKLDFEPLAAPVYRLLTTTLCRQLFLMMAAAKAARKSSGPGSRVPPPPISSSTSPIEIYDSLDYEEHIPPQNPAPVVRRQSNRRGLPPVPLADDNEYTQADDMGGDYLEPDEVDHRGQRRQTQKQQQQQQQQPVYVEQIAPMSQTDEFYYVDARSNPYNNRVYVANQPDYGNRYGGSPPGHYPEDDLYEGPQYEDEFLDPHGYPERNPVDRRQSRKNMGRAIVTGLNTARVKEIKGRLRPAFSPDELIDSVERRNTVGGGGGGSSQDVVESVDVSGLSVMERMKLLESKAASSSKGPPPPTHPKPRPVSLGSATVQPPPKAASAAHSANPSSSSILNSRPAIPANRSEPRLIVTAPPPSSAASSSSSSSSARPSSQIALDEAPWYFGTIDQHRCEQKLKDLNTEGAFLIRQSKKGETRMQPYTLCVFHEDDIYNLMIRQKSNKKLAVGSEKNGEPEFATLADLVKFHADIPIEVISKSSSRKSTGGRVWLKMTPLK